MKLKNYYSPCQHNNTGLVLFGESEEGIRYIGRRIKRKFYEIDEEIFGDDSFEHNSRIKVERIAKEIIRLQTQGRLILQVLKRQNLTRNN